jgi:hypothetical protein
MINTYMKSKLSCYCYSFHAVSDRRSLLMNQIISFRQILFYLEKMVKKLRNELLQFDCIHRFKVLFIFLFRFTHKSSSMTSFKRSGHRTWNGWPSPTNQPFSTLRKNANLFADRESHAQSVRGKSRIKIWASFPSSTC